MKGACVSNSVILRDCVISSGARVDHCLFDKNITVEPGKEMIGGRNYPAAVKNGANI